MTVTALAAVCMGGFIVADILLFVIGPSANECFVLGVFVMRSFLVLQSVLWKREMSIDMKFPTVWYLRAAKAQTSLRIHAV